MVLREFLEVTTAIGCPCNCLQYCPQEIIKKNYQGERTLSFSNFVEAIENVPKNVAVYFSGFCEPFTNSECMKMINYTFEKGFSVGVDSTLLGASNDDVEKLIEYKYVRFCLHLPDGKAFKLNDNSEHMNRVGMIMSHVRNLEFSIMNENFQSNKRENIARGRLPPPSKAFYSCDKMTTPQMVLLPNGNLQLCCMDMSMSHTIGNLFKEKYVDARKKLLSNRGKYTLCRYCCFNIPPRRITIQNIRRRINLVAHMIAESV